VPGEPYAVTQGERNGTTTCPWTWGEILDISDEANPQVAARFMVPENFPQNCFVGGPGDPALLREFSTHQPLVFPNIFFIAWYSGGFRAWDIGIPELPMEVGVFVPRPEAEVIERFRQSPDVWMWPHPFLHHGFFYVTDENSGLYVLQYRGPRRTELPKTGTFHSNDDLHLFHEDWRPPRGGRRCAGPLTRDAPRTFPATTPAARRQDGDAAGRGLRAPRRPVYHAPSVPINRTAQGRRRLP
jgi:hypothetical protein